MIDNDYNGNMDVGDMNAEVDEVNDDFKEDKKEKCKIYHNKTSCNLTKNPGCCVQKEVWLAPPPEKRSSWNGVYVTKGMFLNDLGLYLSGDVINNNHNGNMDAGEEVDDNYETMNAKVDGGNDELNDERKYGTVWNVGRILKIGTYSKIIKRYSYALAEL